MSSGVPDDEVRSRQRQIAGDLRALILAGDLAPGARLPSTAELNRTYGVTNMTVTRALGILKAEGLIEGHKGRAVVVTGRRPAVVTAGHYPRASSDRVFPWITDAAAQGRRGSSELIDVGEVPAPAQVAAAFGIEPPAMVLCRHQLLSLDGEPAELVRAYYPVEIARGTALAEGRLLKGGSPAVLASLGLSLHEAVDRVSARFASVAEFIALRLPEDVPVLRQFRVAYTAEKRPVEVTVMIKAAQLYEVQYVIPR